MKAVAGWASFSVANVAPLDIFFAILWTILYYASLKISIRHNYIIFSQPIYYVHFITTHAK